MYGSFPRTSRSKVTDSFPVARKNGLTPFSVYEAKWNAIERDAEAEIVPMCEDQGMGILTWASLGSGSILTAKQRAEREEAFKKSEDSGERPTQQFTEDQVKVCNVLEQLAVVKKTSIQAIVSCPSPFLAKCRTNRGGKALAYLFSQTNYVIPIVGVNTVEHVKAMSSILEISLTNEEAHRIIDAAEFDPLYPLNFVYNYKGGQPYHLGLTTRHSQQYAMSAYVNAPTRQGVGLSVAREIA